MTGDHSLARWLDRLLRAFFREVEVSGLEQVPAVGGGIVVSWHPNGLVDPALIISQFPRRVVFGARAGLFKWPVLGPLMRRAGTVPIQRAVDAKADADAEQRKAANKAALSGLAQAVADGSFAALFPEGLSHDDSRLSEFKTGAAHLYYQACERVPAGSALPVILPVGLFYDRKHRFRSRALVEFHRPLRLPEELVGARSAEEEGSRRDRARALTALIEDCLHDAVGATEDWATHDSLQRVRKLLRAERHGDAAEGLREERRDFAAVHAAFTRLQEREPQRLAGLRRRVDRYDRDLRNLGLEDTELDGDPPLAARGLLWLLLLQAAFVYFVLPPVLVVGFLVNAPVALLIRAIALLGGRMRKDQATIKLLASVVLYPIAWVGAGVGTALLHGALDEQFALPDVPILAGLTVAFLAMAGGAVALFYLEFARETARSIRVRLTRWHRKRSLARLRHERSRLAHELQLLAREAA